jgi:hypothetical protein
VDDKGRSLSHYWDFPVSCWTADFDCNVASTVYMCGDRTADIAQDDSRPRIVAVKVIESEDSFDFQSLVSWATATLQREG